MLWEGWIVLSAVSFKVILMDIPSDFVPTHRDKQRIIGQTLGIEEHYNSAGGMALYCMAPPQSDKSRPKTHLLGLGYRFGINYKRGER